MRVLVVGAGAVGQVLYRALEEQKGNECTFLVRAGRKAGLARVKLVDARSGTVRVRERPAAVEIGQVRPPVDTVLFCVKGDQLTAALDDVGALPAGTRVATVTPGPEGLALLRARHPGATAARITPTFMAYPEGDTVVVWQPPLLKTFVCHDEGGPDAAAFSSELAAALSAGGVPARARDRMPAGSDAAAAAFSPVLAAYALAGYDADALVRDRALLDLAGHALAETLTLEGAPGFAGVIARRAAAPVLRAALRGAAPRLPGAFRSMWRIHGPKLDGQTRETLAQLLKRAREEGTACPALDEMLRRLGTR